MESRVLLSAAAGGPYSIAEGAALVLDASGSTPLAPGLVAYEWDLNNDGAIDLNVGDNAVFSVPWSTLEALGLPTDGTAVPITLRFTSNNLWFLTIVETDTTNLTITNAAPTPDADGPYDINEGQSFWLDAGGSTDP
ncbi:MAG: hypothetical protein JW810_00460, partial [Sedimentisphaerales bacterium]|nr:hypothetical protein [Sedimentisphaerales bacterium]